ncbi:uncharacterized protein LOC135226270 [Macrobrachium nipponense]|uniref:uncharacterized protein LOC135226270 n=1 Tax=Macrobrachium nipponense TaxID=159736 RepID=UPI0030C86719
MATINNKKAIVVFLNLEKAYELPSAAAIPAALADKAVKGNLLAWAKGYMQDRQARVTFQGATSKFLNLENGTPQGGILSPFLFNILMEKLANSNLPNGVEIFIYADEVCLVSTDRHRAHQNMQIAITQIENKCIVLGLKINTAKTKAMAIKYNTHLNPMQVMGEPIEWVDNFIKQGSMHHPTAKASSTRSNTVDNRQKHSKGAGGSPTMPPHYRQS